MIALVITAAVLLVLVIATALYERKKTPIIYADKDGVIESVRKHCKRRK